MKYYFKIYLSNAFQSVQSRENKQQSIDIIFLSFIFLGFYAKYFDFLSSSQEAMRWGEKDTIIPSTLIKSLQVEFKCIITIL